MTPQRFMAWQSEVLGTVLAANTTMALRSFRVMQALAAGKLPEQRESVRMGHREGRGIFDRTVRGHGRNSTPLVADGLQRMARAIRFPDGGAGYCPGEWATSADGSAPQCTAAQ